ncbi:MAG: hypothetical protein JWP12_2583 [Bacteroidetes bacterium]|nr:hypothetical protein [Bacteroidota bacterium]
MGWIGGCRMGEHALNKAKERLIYEFTKKKE